MYVYISLTITVIFNAKIKKKKHIAKNVLKVRLNIPLTSTKYIIIFYHIYYIVNTFVFNNYH